ncbi:MAG: hypothetical protein NTX55_00860 [Candidatus Parcubacteria bacterium]|nr:hypothetical protein [Candidatus Parcubacteria bacterium]
MEDAKKDLYWAIFFLIILAIVWYYTGGPQRFSSKSGIFLFKPQENYSEELRRETGELAPTASSTESAYKYNVGLRAGYGARESNPQEQFVEITASSQNNKPIKITDWSLTGKSGLDIKIGSGAYLPYSAQVNPQQAIFLNPGEKAVIITGESPIGTSFRLNKCTGYFAQFQNFYPDLPKDCPRPKDENPLLNLNDQCLDYLDRLPACQMQISITPGLSYACQTYINDKINYKTCVEIHKNDSDFYQPEWRVYLGRRETLWKKERETIILKDENKKIIDWVSY